MSRRSEWNADSEEEILTSYEARSLLKIGRTKLWELTRKNLIPAYRVGRSKTSALRYKRSELLAWLDANRVQKSIEKS
jgi:excisionase family DNA binding protein